MPCFYHPDKATFAYCSDCGREVCQECAFGSETTFFCASCCEQGLLSEALEAQGRIRGAWVAAIGCGLFMSFVAVMTPPNEHGGMLGKFVLAAAAAYLVWSVYLVLPEVSNWWQRAFGRPDPSGYSAGGPGLVRMAFFGLAPVFVSCYYGMFGGAIYTYIRLRRIGRVQPVV